MLPASRSKGEALTLPSLMTPRVMTWATAVYFSTWAVWSSSRERHCHGDRDLVPPVVIAVVEDNPADVYIISQVLHAHQLPFVLQVLESSQRAFHYFDRLAAQEGDGCPDLLLLDYTLPGLNMRALLPWMKALPVCRRLRMIVMTGSDDPAIEAEAMALGAEAFFQNPVGFQRFLALGDLIKVVMFGHTQA
jgi:two-component system, chemotaxis family, response regulator Rcp1